MRTLAVLVLISGGCSKLLRIGTTTSMLLHDLNKNGKPDLLRIVGSTLEVRVQ